MRRIAPSKTGTASPETGDTPGSLFAGAFGLLLGLSLVKFGNPVVLNGYMGLSSLKLGGPELPADLNTPPTDLFGWLLASWPTEIGYWVIAGLVVFGMFRTGTT